MHARWTHASMEATLAELKSTLEPTSTAVMAI